MLETILIILLIVAVSMAILSVRLYFGKKFVHTHIDGNKAMARRGIYCVHEMDRRERRKNTRAVKEKMEKRGNSEK